MLDKMATAPFSLSCIAVALMDPTAHSPQKSTDYCDVKRVGATQGACCSPAVVCTCICWLASTANLLCWTLERL